MTLSIMAECQYAECFYIVMLSVVMPNVSRLSVVALLSKLTLIMPTQFLKYLKKYFNV
jgi:hypothetical protein